MNGPWAVFCLFVCIWLIGAFFLYHLLGKLMSEAVGRWIERRRQNSALRRKLKETDEWESVEPSGSTPKLVKLPSGTTLFVDDCEGCGGYRVRSPLGPDWWCDHCGWSHDHDQAVST